MVAGLGPATGTAELLVGLDHGDDAAVVRLDERTGLVSTADFFTPVVDDAYDWGRIAAANALSDVYAMGGVPLLALNLLCWPRDVLPLELAREVLRGGQDVAREAGCHLAGGHSVDDDGPKYGLAVTGMVRPEELITLDAGRAGVPLSLTKPLGVGVLNTRHKATGESFPEAVATMSALNRDAARAAVAAGHPLRHGRDRVRPARARLEAGPRQPAHGGHRHRPGAVSGRRAGGAARRVRQRRQPAQPGLGHPVDRLRRGRRGRAAAAGGRADLRRVCWSPASCRARPWSGELLPRSDHLVVLR